ncbi:MAG: hypothetical protein K2L86_13200 [Lachnospiraceae bacterium]|nr:hypothetical protein [Lachnospiraceae bacterium]
MLNESKENIIQMKIVFDGVDEFKKSIQEIKTDMKNLNECLQEVNNGFEQLLKFLQYKTEIASVVEITKDAMKSKLVGKVEKAQTVFDLLTAVTYADKFAEIIYDLLQKCESPEEIKLFLKQRRDNLDEAIDYLKSHGFPIEHKTC